MLTERYQTQQSQLNSLANKIASDFVNKVAEKIPGKTKYASLLRYFLNLRRKKDGTKLFSKVYPIGKNKIRYTFVYEANDGEDFPGYFYGDEIIIGFAQGNFDFIFPESNLNKVNVIVDRLKESLVHETTHFFQEKAGKRFETTVFADTFYNQDVSKL